MPCYDGQELYELNLKEQKKREEILDIKRSFSCTSQGSYRDAAGFLMTVACEACRALNDIGLLDVLSADSAHWYSIHKKRDELIGEYKDLGPGIESILKEFNKKLQEVELSDQQKNILMRCMKKDNMVLET